LPRAARATDSFDFIIVVIRDIVEVAAGTKI
jgi:hypothetical protein